MEMLIPSLHKKSNRDRLCFTIWSRNAWWKAGRTARRSQGAGPSASPPSVHRSGNAAAAGSHGGETPERSWGRRSPTAGTGAGPERPGALEQQQLFRVHIRTFLPSYMACWEAPPLGKWEGGNIVPEWWLELEPTPIMWWEAGESRSRIWLELVWGFWEVESSVLLPMKAMLYFLFCGAELVPIWEAAEPPRDWTISTMADSFNGSGNGKWRRMR